MSDQEQAFRLRLAQLVGKEKPYAWAARVGLNKGSFTNMWYHGGVPRVATLQKIAAACGCRLEWLQHGEGEWRARPATAADAESFVPDNVADEFYFIPRYDLRASAGFGASAEDETPAFYMAFRKYWVRNYLNASPRDLAVISVKGDSMSGVLEDRDTILVNTAETQPGEGLYVIRIGNDLLVKQLQRLPGGAVQVKSANPQYETFSVDLARDGNEFAVVGRVLWFGRQVA